MDSIAPGRSYIDRGTFIEFLSSYIHDLENGLHDIVDTKGYISKFCNEGPGTALAVTRGIEVHVSTLPTLQPTHEQVYVYRVRMRYLSGECDFPWCRVVLRRWEIEY